MIEAESSVRLVKRWCSGDEAAATAIHVKYVSRLTSLAARLIGPRLRRRVDADDALQSAFRTFFKGSRGGRFTVSHTGQLWNLLVRITRHKVQRQIECHRAQKRDVAGETTGDCALAACPSREAALEDEVALREELEFLLAEHTSRDAAIVRMCLEGFSVIEIADRCVCSRWTVRRVLNRAGGRLALRLRGD